VLANEAGVSFAASRALLLATRGSPLLITRSLMVRLRRIGMAEESLLEKDILKKILDGWFFLGRMSLTGVQVFIWRWYCTVEALVLYS